MRRFTFTLLKLMAIGFSVGCTATDASLNDIQVITETNASLGVILISPSSLPQVILNFIQLNFPDATIAIADKNTDNNGNVTYEVRLDSGREMRFAPDGTLLIASIEGGMNGDPSDNNGMAISPTDLPEAAIDYIIANFPGITITYAEVEVSNNGDTAYEIHLNSGEELHFDNIGNFLFLGSDTNNNGNGNDDGDGDGNGNGDGNDDGDNDNGNDNDSDGDGDGGGDNDGDGDGGG